jgi:hypothetical protein
MPNQVRPLHESFVNVPQHVLQKFAKFESSLRPKSNGLMRYCPVWLLRLPVLFNSPDPIL